MKIAFVNQPLDLVRPPVQNSLGIWTYEVGRQLAREHEVLIYVYGGRYRFGGLHEDGVHYRFVPSKVDRRLVGLLDRLPPSRDPRRPRFASSWYHRAFASAVARDLARQKCDVVHVLNFAQFIPIIRRHNPAAEIVLHMQCEWAVQLDRAMMAGRIAAADLVLGCSEFIAQQVRAAFPPYAERCRAVYNGVDLGAFSPGDGRERPEGEGPRLLFVARVSPEKGVHVLLDAFARVRARYPRARLDIVGAVRSVPYEFVVALSDDPKVRQLACYYDEDYGAHLRRRIPAGAADCVRFTGNLPYAELVGLYRAADVFVFPSVWDEPFGMPNVEAMACGVPVVSTRGGGIPELVEEGATGLLVERGDAEALARAILRLLDDGELRRRMGVAGRERASRLFSWNVIARDLVRHYVEMTPR